MEKNMETQMGTWENVEIIRGYLGIKIRDPNIKASKGGGLLIMGLHKYINSQSPRGKSSAFHTAL